jgi:hypothetical protein
MPAPRSIRACASRFAALTLAAALAACASGGATTEPQVAAAPNAQPPPQGGTIQGVFGQDVPLTPAPPTSVRPQAAARGQQAPAPPPAPVGPPPNILHARAECWNKLEADRKAPRDLEKRAAIVQKCTEDRMRGMPATTTH